MVIENKGKPPKGGIYLVCSVAQRNADCGNRRRWRLEKVEEAVVQALRRVQLPDTPRVSDASRDTLAVLEDKLSKAVARRENLLDLVEEGDETAKGRFRAAGLAISTLKAEIAALKDDHEIATAIPSYSEQMALLREIKARLSTAVGEDLTTLRTQLAQTLRTVMIRIDFDPLKIVGRMRIEHVRYRVGISQGSTFPDGAPVTIVDETPKVFSQDELDYFAEEAAEDRARADAEFELFEEAFASLKK